MKQARELKTFNDTKIMVADVSRNDGDFPRLPQNAFIVARKQGDSVMFLMMTEAQLQPGVLKAYSCNASDFESRFQAFTPVAQDKQQGWTLHLPQLSTVNAEQSVEPFKALMIKLKLARYSDGNVATECRELFSYCAQGMKPDVRDVIDHDASVLESAVAGMADKVAAMGGEAPVLKVQGRAWSSSDVFGARIAA